MPSKINKITLISVLLTFVVIVLGAYTRLRDAGLGCPDWPGCYGALLAPQNDSKAWIEMIHRYVAGTLGLLILFLAIASRRKLALVIAALVIFQALLGMWTVTLRLYPLVVMGHLLGGFAILICLWCFFLQTRAHAPIILKVTDQCKILGVLSLIALSIQIALGGWTSANYAALVCADFPTCQGYWWPPLDWQHAFNVLRVGIFDSPGVPLENTARVTIQMAHRIGALITTVLIVWFGINVWQTKNKILRQLCGILLALLCLQLVLGISNVLAGLPLLVSLAHSATAVMLLLCLISMLHLIYVKHAQPINT